MEQRNDETQSGFGRNREELGRDGNSQLVIPVIQETASVHKEIIETGKVRVRKKVREERAMVNLPIINESYDITRVPAHSVHDTPPPAMRYEGEVMIIPVVKEITVMTKRYEVVEEVRITRRLTETPLMQEVTLRSEEVEVDRIENRSDD
jgi:uncharacterized protein (TIGR02271 family)